MKPIRNIPVKRFAELLKTNKSGYPKSIFDDGETKVQVWNRGSSELVLLIDNRIIPKNAEMLSKTWGHDEWRVSFQPPAKVNSQISRILRSYLFDGPEDFLETDEFLMVRLEDEIAMDIGKQFDEDGVVYKKDIYEQFQKDLASDLDEIDKEYYRTHTNRPTHPNIAIVRDRLEKLESKIEAVEVNEDGSDSYQAAGRILSDDDGCFEEIYSLLRDIPNEGGPREEDEAKSEIERRIKGLKQKMGEKLDEIGYENPEE